MSKCSMSFSRNDEWYWLCQSLALLDSLTGPHLYK